MPTDPWVEAAKNFKAQPQEAPSPSSDGKDDWKVWQAQGDASQPLQSTAQEIGSTLKDAGIGVLKGMGSTMSAADEWSRKHLPAFMTNTGMGFGKPEDIQAEKELLQPKNTAQSIGKGVEQAGEFLVPGLGEEAATADLAKAAPKMAPLARLGYNALTSGAINKMQGGGFGTGALAGGAASGIGEGLKALAPSIAESSLGIRKLDRAYGKRPGLSALSETRGFTPGAVAESARGRLNQLNPELERIASNGGVAPVNLQTPRDVIGNAEKTAISRNAAGSYQQLQPMARHLAEEFATGAPIGPSISPIQALNLKRGFGDEFIHNWNPETMSGTRGTAAKAYRALADEIHSSAPGTKALDERISSLIPVAKRAESTERNAETGQRVAGRVLAHTGALTGAALGGTEGYREHGLSGALVGGGLGLIAPEIIGSPTSQMMAARLLNSPASRVVPKVLAGGILQTNR